MLQKKLLLGVTPVACPPPPPCPHVLFLHIPSSFSNPWSGSSGGWHITSRGAAFGALPWASGSLGLGALLLATQLADSRRVGQVCMCRRMTFFDRHLLRSTAVWPLWCLLDSWASSCCWEKKQQLVSDTHLAVEETDTSAIVRWFLLPLLFPCASFLERGERLERESCRTGPVPCSCIFSEEQGFFFPFKKLTLFCIGTCFVLWYEVLGL